MKRFSELRDDATRLALQGAVRSWAAKLMGWWNSRMTGPTTAPVAGRAPVLARRRTDALPLTKPSPALTPIAAQAGVLKAHRDALTGLVTRDCLNDSADQLLRDLRGRGLSLCVLRIGLDGFDAVKQRYGKEAGDKVLVQVAKRLRQLAREADIVARLDGEEFALLLSCEPDQSAAFSRKLAARLIAELQRPLSYRTVSNLHLGGNVGSAIWPVNGSTLDAVLCQAEEALAVARRSGRGATRQFAGRNSTGSGDEAVAA